MYSIWLTFVNKDRKYLSQIIHELSERHQSPKFIPHITMYSGVEKITDADINKLHQLEVRMKHIKVKMDSIKHSSYLWKTIYIQIFQNDFLVKIQTEIDNNFCHLQCNSYNFDPHISLIYKSIPSDIRQTVADKLVIKSEYHCDRLKIVKTGTNVDNWIFVN